MRIPATAIVLVIANAAVGCPATLNAADGPAAKKTQRLPAAVPFPLTLPITDTEHVSRLNRHSELSAFETCQELGRTTASEFVRSRRGWECTSYAVMDNGADPASLFLQIKGETENSFSSFRIKLNLGDATGKEGLLETAGNLLERFPFDLSSSSRTYLLEKVARLAPFASPLENYKAHFVLERSGGERYNLLVRPDVDQASDCRFPSSAPPVEPILMRVPIECVTLSDG